MISGASGAPTAPPSPAEAQTSPFFLARGKPTERFGACSQPHRPKEAMTEPLLSTTPAPQGAKRPAKPPSLGRGRRVAWAEFRKPVAEAANDIRRVSGLLDALALRCRTPSCSSLPGYWRARWPRRCRPIFGVVDDPRGKRQNSKDG
jgi:hypothetical protein